jgi:hypothetical protein
VAGRRSSRDCQRALWLLGLTAPTDRRSVQAAWRARVAQTHPDRHSTTAQRTHAAETLTRALNDAKETLYWWIDQDRDWPVSSVRDRAVRFHEPEPWPDRDAAAGPAPICQNTGLRAGDRVRRWPYTSDELLTVRGTERDERDRSTWVLVHDDAAHRAERVRLAAYTCPVCGQCAGPVVDELTVRPCPDCLVDLRRLAQRPLESGRVRRAIEARAEAGLAEARSLNDARLVDRAVARRRWARRLAQAGQDDLHAALVAAFTRAFDRWAQAPDTGQVA